MERTIMKSLLIFSVFFLALQPMALAKKTKRKPSNTSCLPEMTVTPLDAEVRIPADPDSSSPHYWSRENGQWKMSLFTSSWGSQEQHTVNSMVSGPDIRHLKAERIDVGTAPRNSLHWIEGIFYRENMPLMGWYHSEFEEQCGQGAPNASGYAPGGKRVPRMGYMTSKDGGKTWKDHGIVLSAADGGFDCSKTKSVFFAGGHGDPWVIPDRSGETFYMYFGNYASTDYETQGISVARLPAKLLDTQVGSGDGKDAHSLWKKYIKGSGWTGDGLSGRSTPIFKLRDPHRHGYLDKKPDAFWGPAIYFDHKTQMYIMLMSRTVDKSGWRSEGYYVSYNKDVGEPDQWSPPQRIDVPGKQGWYPQLIMESHSGLPYTEIDGGGLLFIHGKAKVRLSFNKPTACQ